MATGPIETHLHRSFNWENAAPGPREGPRGRSANCGNGLFAQCVRLRSEINPLNALILETRCLALTGLKQNGAAMAQPKILLTRIDDRFIYGQDVVLWNEAVGSNLVLIVNDEIAADSRKWAPMRVAAPEGVWMRFFSVQRTIDIIHTATPRQWILIMVASPADALALVKGGVPITKISIGHMQAGEGKRPITPAVAVDDADVAAFKELQALGIELEIRYLPSSAPDPIGNLFN